MNSKKQTNALSDKKIVILGGTSGIGLATAIAAAGKGAHLVIVSSNQQNIDKALELLPGEGHSGYQTDLTKENEIKILFESIGELDHLVFTAGESLNIGKISEINIAEAKQFFDLRYWGAYLSVKFAVANFREGGSIVFTGGTAARRPGPGWSLGASICSAMEAFTRSMAVELAPIRVNIVVPGLVKTNLWSNFNELDRTNMFQQYAATLPVKHVGEADEIALTYIYLMEQSYSTGQSVIVDGGGVLV